ncbi:hypothetical protein NC652_024391 [Populus alba x Populus x berolinensis]|nr:hypothetical protein NC652_024391 [Populus alba x Populus x berolinensis]
MRLSRGCAAANWAWIRPCEGSVLLVKASVTGGHNDNIPVEEKHGNSSSAVLLGQQELSDIHALLPLGGFGEEHDSVQLKKYQVPGSSGSIDGSK